MLHPGPGLDAAAQNIPAAARAAAFAFSEI